MHVGMQLGNCIFVGFYSWLPTDLDFEGELPYEKLVKKVKLPDETGLEGYVTIRELVKRIKMLDRN